LLLLLLINGTPPVLAYFFSGIFRRPVDCGIRFFDGYPFLGNHKTMGGFLAGILAGSIFGSILGFPIIISFWSGLLSMAGDSFTSFIKRRLKVKPGFNIFPLDQFFEGILPLLLIQRIYALTWSKTLVLLFLFIIMARKGSLLLMKILPSNKNKPDCVIRSKARFREWRACHTALSPLARMLNFENIIYYHLVMKGLFKCMGIYNKGKRNALQVRLKSLDLSFPELPEAFENYRILFLSDLHLDGLEGLSERLVEIVSKIKVDVCLLGGDYRMEMYGPFDKANRKLGELIKYIDAPDGVFGVLGNHDCLEIAPEIEDSGVCMLINDSITLQRGGDAISIIGVDDPHYYKCHNMEKAFMDVPAGAFSVLMAHSPEIIQDTNGRKIDLCLCGHTHGGQIRLPYIGTVFTHCKAPRRFASGLWKHGSITGYTSIGAGASGVPVRFNCPPEVVLATLRRA
jgi:predicted MPP superfamily phosphohydrolase